jgi:hypothetical protein
MVKTCLPYVALQNPATPHDALLLASGASLGFESGETPPTWS